MPSRSRPRQLALPVLVVIGAAVLSLILFGAGAKAQPGGTTGSSTPTTSGANTGVGGSTPPAGTSVTTPGGPTTPAPTTVGGTTDTTGGAQSGYGSPATGQTPAPNQASRENRGITDGHTLFVEACSSCHGVDAAGTARAPTLQGLGAATVDFWVRTGRMPLALPEAQARRKPPVFDARQARDIANYVASLAPGGISVPSVDPSAGDLQQGGELFRLDCATCHSFVAAGGTLSYGAYAPSLAPDSPLDVAEAIRTGPGNMPRFSTAELSQKDMNSIIRYVQYIVHPDDHGGLSLGHVGPVTEGLIAFVLGVGLLMLAAFWIGDRA